MAVAVHTRQTSHLPCVTTGQAPMEQPRNLEHRFGQYFEVYVRNGDVWYRASHRAVPPFWYDVAATAVGDASYPVTTIDARAALTLLYQRGAGDVWRQLSYDGGRTWEAATLAISGGTKPYGAVNPYDGTELIGAFLPATEKIALRRRHVGELNYGSVFHFADSGGDVLFSDDTFGFWWGFESPNRLVAHVRVKGEAVTSTWYSADAGTTWTRM